MQTLSPRQTPSSVLKTPPSERRHSYNVGFKLMIVEWHRKNGRNVSQTARKFNIDRKRVRDWESQYDMLFQRSVDKDKKQRRLGSGRVPLSGDLDQKVLEFLEDERSEGRPVTNKQLKATALQIAGGMGLSFSASDSWFSQWKQRFCVGYRCFTNTAQKCRKTMQKNFNTFGRT